MESVMSRGNKRNRGFTAYGLNFDIKVGRSESEQNLVLTLGGGLHLKHAVQHAVWVPICSRTEENHGEP
jgi:hypothetical protein